MEKRSKPLEEKETARSRCQEDKVRRSRKREDRRGASDLSIDLIRRDFETQCHVIDARLLAGACEGFQAAADGADLFHKRLDVVAARRPKDPDRRDRIWRGGGRVEVRGRGDRRSCAWSPPTMLPIAKLFNGPRTCDKSA